MWQSLFCKLSMKTFILRTFWPSKLKEGQFLAKKSKKVPFLLFLIKSKIIENEKVLFSQMFRVWRKKFQPFQRKNEFLAVFVILEKIRKTAKNPFFLWKGGNFFWHTLIIWGNSIFSFSILFDSIKKKSKKTLFFTFFLAKNCPSFNFEGQKVRKI